MASSYTRGLSTITGAQNMLIDMLALILVPWFGSFIFGVFSFELNIFGGYDFTAPIWTVGGAEISASLLIVLFGIVWILATNEIDGSSYEPEEFVVIAFALLAPVMYVFVPAFESLVMWHDVSQLGFTLLLAAATVHLSYTA
ncbi:hypothetical protein RH858_08100 [Halalkaliarchaeum sp. AArc-GB]|uniref:hypothetical protein n=1 Tax=Halalkaliarchaeum sp. AArc-GB TaxID=3074078 RepID=UPI0028642203|nr:hypothetical protein [Halalkaliarchaeum sp. AArc-GB]MDR5673110.1 hypothetical protein [Halalkaliarchaeum sp. AArc-GB]